MNIKSRVQSVIKAICLDSKTTGVETFHLSDLELSSELDFPLPTNLRLGHLVEKVVAELIKSSSNYKLLYENIQITEGKNTIGELDFIVEEIALKRLIHIELAYKFYLLDPSISSDPICNWIGPNRNDALVEKVSKLKTKQFPLLYNKNAQSSFGNIEVDNVSQALCFLVSLYIPYEYKLDVDHPFNEAIKGYYLNFETFIRLDNTFKLYCIPQKTEWGNDPAENDNWTNLNGVNASISESIEDKRSVLCWQKNEDSYSSFFIVWW